MPRNYLSCVIHYNPLNGNQLIYHVTLNIYIKKPFL